MGQYKLLGDNGDLQNSHIMVKIIVASCALHNAGLTEDAMSIHTDVTGRRMTIFRRLRRRLSRYKGLCIVQTI